MQRLVGAKNNKKITLKKLMFGLDLMMYNFEKN